MLEEHDPQLDFRSICTYLPQIQYLFSELCLLLLRLVHLLCSALTCLPICLLCFVVLLVMIFALFVPFRIRFKIPVFCLF
jgi:hypothetical protein